MHTHEVAVTNLKWGNLMLVASCISSNNLMIFFTFLLVALSWGLKQLGLRVCWSYKELIDAQHEITPKIMRLTTYQIWILPSSRRLGFIPLTIHVRYVQGQMMLIRCYFAVTIMVDTISSALNRSSFKFPPTFAIVHHVFLQHLDFYSDHAMFFPTQV